MHKNCDPAPCLILLIAEVGVGSDQELIAPLPLRKTDQLPVCDSGSAQVWFSVMLQSLNEPDFDDRLSCKAKASGLRAELKRKGTTIGSLATLIAAHALSQGALLVTNNTDEFARVPGCRHRSTGMAGFCCCPRRTAAAGGRQGSPLSTNGVANAPDQSGKTEGKAPSLIE
jgi:hypothetical protein